jgi:hypothetical protein
MADNPYWDGRIYKRAKFEDVSMALSKKTRINRKGSDSKVARQRALPRTKPLETHDFLGRSARLPLYST